MCECIHRWQEYDAARKAHNIAMQRTEALSDYIRDEQNAWARYIQARNACDVPGQHPHRQK